MAAKALTSGRLTEARATRASGGGFGRLATGGIAADAEAGLMGIFVADQHIDQAGDFWTQGSAPLSLSEIDGANQFERDRPVKSVGPRT